MSPLSSTQTPEPVSTHTRTRNNQVTPPGTQPSRAKKLKMDTEAEPDLAPVFRSDLTNLRSLVTCSICDQLLYEPFTIQCGHTYCYSCLCSWFVPNKRKKTCPECRTIIKQMPAPSFMIKQMVEVFVNRAELMPADESVEQHATKRAEEVAAVDLDRNGPNGLFKGLFPAGRQELILDEADGVHRCPHCNHEYTGGPSCEACGYEIDDDDLHDFSAEDLDEMSEMEDYEEQQGVRQEVVDDFGEHHNGLQEHLARVRQFQHHHHHAHHSDPLGDESSSIDSRDSRDDVEDDDRSESESEREAEDEEGSLLDFIEHDSPVVRNRRHATPQYNNVVVEVTPHAEPPRRGQPINISDDDSDEGGPVVSRGRRTRWSRQGSTQPSVINLVEDDSSASDTGDVESEAERLRYNGWSPLHEVDPDENESDNRAPTSNGSDDDSDTETIGNDDGGSPRRRVDLGEFRSRTGRQHEWQQESDADDDASEDGTNVDRDGDTEMSVSPDAHVASRHLYDDYPESEVSQADTDYDYNENYDQNSFGADGVELGVRHNIQGVDDDSSDGWPSETHHRRRPRVLLHNQEQEESYNSRISRIFASHQDNLMREGTSRNPTSLEDGVSFDQDFHDFQGLDFNHDHSVRQPANSSRTRRPARAYRTQESRSQNAQRRTQSPPRIMATSMRQARTPRPYDDRSRGVSEIRYQY